MYFQQSNVDDFILCGQDVNYTTPLIIPVEGIELRTTVYVQVLATNLTSQ